MRCSTLRVVGIGNPLFGDEGIGYHIARSLLSCGAPPSLVYALEVLDVSAIFPIFENVECVIMLDAVKPEDAKEIKVLELRSDDLEGVLEELIESPVTIDPHTLSPLQLLFLAYATGTFRGNAYMILIPAESLEVGELSQNALTKAIKVLKVLEALLNKLGVGEIAKSVNEECYRREVLRLATYSTT